MPWTVFSEENFKQMVEHAPIGILIIDRDMKWRFINDRFCQITGYSREELAGKTFLDITYKEDIDRNLNLYNRLLAGEVNEYYYEKRYVRKDGQIIWVRLAVSAVRTEAGYSHMVVSVEDIDETKKNQHMLEVRNDELDTLLYKASHDLKSPVTTLAGLCNLLVIENESLRSNDVFVHIEETIQLLKNQNDSLLDLTRIQEWKPMEQRVALATLVDGILRDLPLGNAIVRRENLHVELVTDASLLSMGIRRIIENALMYVRPGGAPEVTITYSRIPGQHRITIADQGTGIPQQELGHILGMFYRASIHSHGSGLGLYIVKKVMEKLRGEILVESVDGKGSSFALLLP